MEPLDVYLHRQQVGQLVQIDGGLSFHYRAEYLQSAAPQPLSRHLPLAGADRSFAAGPTRAFFENLLPEGDVRVQLARRLGVSQENIFALLTELGGDCAGAVQLLPVGQVPEGAGGYRTISEAELAVKLVDLPHHPFLTDEEGVRLSLAGAQNKLPVYFDGERFSVPTGEAASTHILKIPIHNLENTVVNEAFCMNLAQRVGLNVPFAKVVNIAGSEVYLVERYDRRKTAEGLIRLHQEDFCQALGVESACKYEKEGGPGFAACFELLRDWSDEPLTDVAALLRWALFNFLIGNADAHGKNISFLYAEGQVRLAPFYDLISTAVYEPRVNNKFAMRMGGRKDPRYLSAADLAGFADQLGIGLRVVKRELSALVERVEAVAPGLAQEYRCQFDTPVIIGWIEQVLAQRNAKLRRLG